jgi:hypothetical protein
MTMSRLLYTLEDHFEALADRQKGQFLGWLSRGLSNAFAIAGDVWQATSGRRTSVCAVTTMRCARAGFLTSARSLI